MPPFDPAKKHILESEEYRRILPVEPLIEAISEIEIRRNVAVDVGAGTGHFTIPLAKIFRKVYAIEISMEMAEYLHKKAHSMGVKNIGVIVTERPPELKAEFALFANVLHEMKKPEEYLEWASKMNSVVAVIDWKENAPFGPPLEERISEEEMAGLLGRFFDVIERRDAYRYHYFLLGKRSR